MAGELKSGFFLFDQQETSAVLAKEERLGFSKRLKLFLKSRYALLTIIFLLVGAMIFYNTASLQLNPSAAAGVNASAGVPRQLTMKAARGEIVDAAGIPLAYSKMTNTLMIAYAGLGSAELNAMLLDLSLFMDQYQATNESDLGEYFSISHEECLHPAGEGTDCGKAVFAKEEDDILSWQTDSNLFNLKLADAGQTGTFDNAFVKTDPEIFYKYLLYTRFNIEDPEADGTLYSREQAFRIMQLRYMIMENSWGFLNGTPVTIAHGISDTLVAAINEQNYRFKGVITGQEYQRAYTGEAALVSHVLGYVGPVSAEQYKDLRSQGYALDAVVGQAGVENTAERYLAGQDGVKPYNIWTIAEESGAFFSEKIGKDPVSGYNVRLTINLELQKIAQQSLQRVINEIRDSPDNKNKGDADAGAVVMMDVKTGAILAMVSEPGYDPNDFISQSFDQAAMDRVEQYLSDNINKPMWNRAIMEIYAPGSTFKPVTAVAALESGAITPTSNIIRCKGHEIIGEWPWRCLEKPVNGHGNLTLEMALATSCNMYFYNLGYRTGINQIDFWGQKLGLGEYTGIDLPGEAKGIRASRMTKKLLRNNPGDQIWFPADTCQTAIGQFDNSFTILQLAVYAATLATGNRVTPYVIGQISRSDGVIIQEGGSEPIPAGLKKSTLQAVKKGMLAVVNNEEGTAYRAFKDFPVKVAAKTGTAETGFEDISSSNGLFICYAPADNPQVAIAQIVEKGAWGSNTIGIAKDLLASYFEVAGTEDGDTAVLAGLTGYNGQN
jgi:penicillin-binding protein 2